VILKRFFQFFLALALIIGILLALAWAPDRPVELLSPRWAPAPSSFIAVEGMQVHVRDEGLRSDTVPIVLLHGTSASLHTWEGWVAALKDQRRIITFDLPGFGLTGPHPQNDYSMAAYTRFVIATLDAIGVQRFVIGGNSLGGGIAWQVAAALPQRAQQLILVDASGYPLQAQSVPIGFRIAAIPQLAWLMRNFTPRVLVAESVRNVYGDPARVSDALVDRYYELTLRSGNRDALSKRFAQADWGAGSERIKTLKLPTLILWGGKDRLIAPEHARQFERDIAGSRLVMFDDLGHVPHEEDAARTVLEAKKFLGL
jgi:pimeloyl-ACP methyl ester carboxylesterase